jgi:hypothetical protein
METDPLLIAEMKTLFKAGATVSRILRNIIAHLGQKPLPEMDRLVRAYFRQAFGIPMFSGSAGVLTEDRSGLQMAYVNRNVIHQIISNRSEWDQETAANGQVGSSWIDSLTATDESQLVEQSHPEMLNELSGDWDKLDDKAKKFIKRLIGNSRALNEKVEILATLAEQLQQQVLALETEVSSSV